VAVYQLIEGYQFDELSGKVRRNGTATRLEPQPAAVLTLIVSRAGDLVTHDEIRRAVWGDDTHVSFQDSVHYCIRQIRSTLGDRAQDARFVQTIPKRGYRLKSEAVVRGATSPPPAALPRVSIRRSLTIASLAVALAVVVAIVEQRPNNHHQIAVTVLKTVHDLVF
jgi:DNA-binding winged helix-turn-helix (wHTH) protein